MDSSDGENTSSPMSASAKQDGFVPLRTKIALGKNPSVIMPFYCMKLDLPSPSELSGERDLLEYYNLRQTYSKFCESKKLKEELSAFMPHLPGDIDTPASKDNSSLRELIEKPPIVGKEILPLSSTALAAFRLMPGPVSEEYRALAGVIHKKKQGDKRKRRTISEEGPIESDEESKAKPDKRKKHKRDKKQKRKTSADNSGVSTPMDTDSMFDM